MHTLNTHGNPDTITIIDPEMKYDMVVNTLPRVEVKDITIKKGMHNHIKAYTPQGKLSVKIKGRTKKNEVKVILRQDGKSRTLNVQDMKEVQQYIIGKYDVEVLTLPRLYFDDIDIAQGSYEYINIAGSGQFRYQTSKLIEAQIFVKSKSGEFEWVFDLDAEKTKGELYLQPGDYKIVYRQQGTVSTDYTLIKTFMVQSGETTSVNL